MGQVGQLDQAGSRLRGVYTRAWERGQAGRSARTVSNYGGERDMRREPGNTTTVAQMCAYADS